jgi:serine/threonine-protein kinase RsbW
LVDRSSYKTHGHLAETYPAIPESIPEARRAVGDFVARIGADERAVEAVRLATSEAVTNAVRYAYNGGDGPIHLRAAPFNGGVAITVADDGRGVRPRLDRKGLGLGLALIAQAADEVKISRRPGGGTELQITFETLSPRR